MGYTNDWSYRMPLSAEGLLISALLNTESVGEEVKYGISPHLFEGYSDEYNWLANYVETYGCQPTRDIFNHKFPGFAFSEHADVRSAADMVHTQANKRRITVAITEAMELMHLGETEQAHRMLVDAAPRRAVVKPSPCWWPPITWTTGTTVRTPWRCPTRRSRGTQAACEQGTCGTWPGGRDRARAPTWAPSASTAYWPATGSCFYSLEMSEDEVRARFHASLATEMGYPTITLTNLRACNVDRGSYRRFIGELAERLEATGGSLDIHTPADGPVSPSTIAARCGEYQMTVIDYVGLMAQDGGGRAIDDWRVMASISNSLKYIALSQKTAILCAAQINRDGETGHAPPKVKNLAQSDALGQDGDVVLTMRSKPHDVATHFSIEKNRHGPSGIGFYTTFDPNTGTYTEISADHAEDLVINAEALATPPLLHLRCG